MAEIKLIFQFILLSYIINSLVNNNLLHLSINEVIFCEKKSLSGALT